MTIKIVLCNVMEIEDISTAGILTSLHLIRWVANAPANGFFSLVFKDLFTIKGLLISVRMVTVLKTGCSYYPDQELPSSYISFQHVAFF